MLRIKIANQEIVTPCIVIAIIPFTTRSQIESLSAKAFIGIYFLSEANNICLKHVGNMLSDLLSLYDPKCASNILQVRYVKTNNDADQNQNFVLRVK